MITFKFEDLDTGRKQDINCFEFPSSDNIRYISNVNCYVYNTGLERIEFFGDTSRDEESYYDHESRKWIPFELGDGDEYVLECVEIVIK